MNSSECAAAMGPPRYRRVNLKSLWIAVGLSSQANGNHKDRINLSFPARPTDCRLRQWVQVGSLMLHLPGQ
jgi:hypothetical protein